MTCPAGDSNLRNRQGLKVHQRESGDTRCHATGAPSHPLFVRFVALLSILVEGPLTREDEWTWTTLERSPARPSGRPMA